MKRFLNFILTQEMSPYFKKIFYFAVWLSIFFLMLKLNGLLKIHSLFVLFFTLSFILLIFIDINYLGNLYNKIPTWVTVTFRLVLLFLFVLKLCGITLIDFLINDYYLKMYFIFAWLFLIVFHLTNLFLLHLFMKKSITIPEILPDFLIDFLKDLESVSTKPETTKELKQSNYRLIGIYIFFFFLLYLQYFFN